MRQIIPKLILTVITAVFTALTFAQPGRAQSTGPGRDMNREKVIWQGLEKVAPKSVETFKAATEAFDKDEYEQAAKLYRQVMEKAPGFDPLYRRLGSALALSGNVDEGMRYLERGYEMNASPENMVTLARFLAAPGAGKQASSLDKLRALELAKKALAAYQAQGR